MSCPSFESLSAYADGEATAAEAAALRTHVAGCGACARRLAGIEGMARALASAMPEVPEPAVLEESLLGLAPRRPRWAEWFEELGAGLATPVGAMLAAALAVAFVLWSRRGPAEPPTLELPAEVLMAAHRRYEATLPLAAAEPAPPEAAPQLAGLPEAGDVY